MNRAVLLTALLGAMGTACLAQAPQLSRSEPANGAVDVPVNIGVIRFHFDRDMDTGKMTLTRHGGETFPPTPQYKPSAWRDARCCELRVWNFNRRRPTRSSSTPWRISAA